MDQAPERKQRRKTDVSDQQRAEVRGPRDHGRALRHGGVRRGDLPPLLQGRGEASHRRRRQGGPAGRRLGDQPARRDPGQGSAGVGRPGARAPGRVQVRRRQGLGVQLRALPQLRDPLAPRPHRQPRRSVHGAGRSAHPLRRHAGGRGAGGRVPHRRADGQPPAAADGRPQPGRQQQREEGALRRSARRGA